MNAGSELSWRMFICDEENQLLRFLKSNPNVYFSAAELCRKAGSKKLAVEDPRWAFPFLASLADKHLIERDDQGHYRFVSDE